MMPIGGRRYDYQYGGRGFMLARGSYKGRAWSRTGRADTPSQRSEVDARFGVLPDALDHPEVWDDWTGGFGHAYRRTGEPTYHWGENFDARFPRQLVHCQLPRAARDTIYLGSGVDATFGHRLETQFEVLDSTSILPPSDQGSGVILLLGSSALTRVEPTGSGLEVKNYTTFAGGQPFNTRAAVYGSYTYCGYGSDGLGGGALVRIEYSAGTYVNAALPTEKVAVAGNKLWRSFGFVMQSCADPAAGAVASTSSWSATLNIGNHHFGVADLVVVDDQLIAGTSDGLYVGDSSGSFYNVLSEVQGQSNSDNCRDLTIHQGAVIAPHVAGLFAYQSDGFTARITEIGPLRTHRAPVSGRFRAVMSHGGWLYGGLYTGSQSWLLARGNSGAWHTLQRFPHTTKISRLRSDNLTTASGGIRIPYRFWALTTADTGGTAPVYWWPVPAMDNNPLVPSGAFSANYIGSARIDLGSVDWGAPGTSKVYRAVEVWADTLLSGYRYADVYYDVDQSGSFTLLGRAQTSPKSTLYFSSGEGSFVTGQSIELSLRSFTASPAFSPVYRSLVLRGALQPRSVDMITAVTRIADGIRDRQGAEMRSGAVMLQELRDFASPDVNGVQGHQLIDLAGATQWAKILGPIEEQEVYNQGEEYPEVAATVKFAVLTFS